MLRTRFTARGEDRMFRDTFYAFGIISRLRGAVARWRGGAASWSFWSPFTLRLSIAL
jgi:hypothetical protein